MKYHKIPTVYARDPETKFKTLIEGRYATPELAYLADNPWIFTEKVDGTNIRIMLDGTDIRLGGKTDEAQIPNSIVTWFQENILTQRSKFDEIFPPPEEGDRPPVCIYGEGYGPKIQKGGGNYRKDNSVVVFDIRIGHWWLKRDDVGALAAKLDLDVVPVIGVGTLPDMVKKVKAGFNSRWGDFEAEGIVARPDVDLLDRAGKRIITKLKMRDFK
jgi:hypothetical protein